MCPSRSRPKTLATMIESFLATTSRAHLVVYLDDDDPQMVQEHPRITALVGPRVGPAQALNSMVACAFGFASYGMIPDDCVLNGSRVDHALTDFSLLPNGIGAISPRHSMGDHFDLPFVSRHWLDRLGWFAFRGSYRWCWPTVIEVLAGDRVVRPSSADLFVRHNEENMGREGFGDDSLAMYDFLRQHFYASRAALYG